MSNICLDVEKKFFNRLGLGRLVCSFIFFVGLFFSSDVLNAQNITSENADSHKNIISLEDTDGDSLNDAIFENKNIKVVISSKTGAPSLYYLKGKSFEENLYPAEILDMGYSIHSSYQKPLIFDNTEGTFSKVTYNVEIEGENETGAVIRATANVSLAVDKDTPDSNSVSLIRRFYFPQDGYSFKIENTVTNLKEKLISLGDDSNGSFSLSYGPGVFMDPFGTCTLLGLKGAGVHENFYNAEKLSGAGKLGAFIGAGVKNQYFGVMIESDQQISITATDTQAITNTEKKPQTVSLIKCVLPKFNLGAKESRVFSFNVYAGPFVLEELQKINRTGIAEFGFLNTIMLKTLRFFYSLFPNYGIAIILLTLLVRLVLYPLTLNQTKAMAKMQKIQPKLRDIQDRFKDDPQKMNEEVMKLYTKNNVNPLSGCLPILLQLPIIMALYNTFRIAVELRKAPFLWMTDLSKSDPYLILPIAITALMFYQQGKSTMDPAQKQAMAFMPMMMFVITWSLPSGLLVYWFASSVLGLLQQLQANQYMASIKEE